MDKIYRETPLNFAEISPYVITDIESIGKEIILSEKCYFYDTCSFRNHMLAPNADLIFDFIKTGIGIVVITRTIIMELCSNDGKLWDKHIQYIKNMYQSGIKILVIYEEDLFKVLHTYCNDVVEINKWLSYAVRNAKSKTGSVESVINRNIKLKKTICDMEECIDSRFAEKMFRAVRAEKKSGDNMGEEMLAICVHWLSHIREITPYKYIIVSDDKKAMRIFGKVIKNFKEYSECDMITVFTTPKLCYQMKINGIVVGEQQIADILSVCNSGNSINVFCSEEFELYPTEKTMSVELFARKVITQNIKIYY